MMGWSKSLSEKFLCGQSPERTFRRDSHFWAMCIVLCSALDAFLTIHHIHEGGSELNPVMALALDHSFLVFVGIKMGLTIGGVWVLTRYRYVVLAFHALRGGAVIYLGILAYHGFLLWSV